ncbi:MAG: hypothetical protein WD749_15030 [Phycisphaerales bacterium]
MDEPIDWSLGTFEGLRRRQHEEFYALPFREKLERIEQMAEVAALFARATPRVASPGAPSTSAPPGTGTSSVDRPSLPA